MVFKIILINKPTGVKELLNAVDLNRVGTALNYLRDRLTGVCGRDITWQAKTEKR